MEETKLHCLENDERNKASLFGEQWKKQSFIVWRTMKKQSFIVWRDDRQQIKSLNRSFIIWMETTLYCLPEIPQYLAGSRHNGGLHFLLKFSITDIVRYNEIRFHPVKCIRTWKRNSRRSCKKLCLRQVDVVDAFQQTANERKL